MKFPLPPAKVQAYADTNGVPPVSLFKPLRQTDYIQRAIDLIDLAAGRHERDASCPDLRPVLPSSDESFNAQIGQSRIAILAMCLSHIAEHGDGALSSFLGDCLQQVPECEAYTDCLCDLDTAISRGEVPVGSKWGLFRSLDQGRDMSGVKDRSAFAFGLISAHGDSLDVHLAHSD
ncbi:hypothetical protein [Polaromonas sp.]|uniref:hypothetical protein n=1 Tax=Polaromonas sp. TaxID=1869339 RepID=UPI00273050C2|nr:hypothetical protein [Polaromonas sp.]